MTTSDGSQSRIKSSKKNFRFFRIFFLLYAELWEEAIDLLSEAIESKFNNQRYERVGNLLHPKISNWILMASPLQNSIS